MKATGIVRRIDDLGRIVIPKEIRKTLKIKEGSPIEIFTDTDNTIALKKYSPVKELSDISDEYAQGLSEILGCTVIICDSDTVISVQHASKKDYLEADITPSVAHVIWERKVRVMNKGSAAQPIPLIDKDSAADEYRSQCIAPILTEGDPVGAVIAFVKGDGKEFDDSTAIALKTTSILLSKQMTM